MIAEMFQLSMNSVLFFTGAIVGAVLLAVWGNKADEKALKKARAKIKKDPPNKQG